MTRLSHSRRAERERFRAEGFDPDAVEQLLRRFPPADRATKLSSLVMRGKASDRPVSDGASAQPDITVLESISDPTMQELLDSAWAPRWRGFTLEQLELITEDLPGLKIAIREARQRETDP